MVVIALVALVLVGIGVAVLAGARIRRSAQDAVRAAAVEIAALRTELEETTVRCERFQAAIENVSEGVVIADDDGRELFRNARADRYKGGRGTEAVAEEALDRLLAAAVAGRAGQQELALFGPPRANVHVSAGPLLLGGVQVGVGAFLSDVTELRRVEQVRRDFVANVSHELKTPIGALELLAETVASSDDPPVQRRLAGQLVNEADRLARIVDDLLDLSLIEAQETPLRETVAMNSLVELAVDRVRALADSRGITLSVLPVAGAVLVRCDTARVVGALMNLLDNAVKYSDSDSEITVGTEIGPDQVTVRVTDQGIGIPSSDLERIFERFYRVDKARSRATGGTGLGLAIVRHVAQAHGGDVTVESREGQGTTFRFVLPLDQRSGSDARRTTEGSTGSPIRTRES